MTREELDKYISDGYYRWLDYAKYHCSHTSMDEEAIDVLNEVMVMLLEKYNRSHEYIIQLYNKKKGTYRELDYYILQMIKLNIQSPTSPYRHKYRHLPVDANVDFQQLNLIEEEYVESDGPGEILKQVHLVRNIFESLQLSDKAKRLFSWKFFEGNSLSEWKGPEDKNYLCNTYNKILEMIKSAINGNIIYK
ncbi:hypothetical protein GGR21_002477 [Dysgonomonas hofstadii]|uniref:Uncharacterized protein n=1 Tax=Dysgonomonas hofstadii TaxID=637886 RepID=A0A840CN91_9BACT|nr:hypothetical protein [Dysgonomonas hofstadii]MBB4036571.1 hypothetical protein [Dysgonomonas hofstadii]